MKLVRPRSAASASAFCWFCCRWLARGEGNGYDGGGAGEEQLRQSAELPELSADLDVARENIARWGYALTPEQVWAYRERLLSQVAGEAAAGIGRFDNGELKLNQRVWNLVNKGQILRELLPELLGEELHPVQLYREHRGTRRGAATVALGSGDLRHAGQRKRGDPGQRVTDRARRADRDARRDAGGVGC